MTLEETTVITGSGNRFLKGVAATGGIMVTLIIYGYYQERIMTLDYNEERFKYSLFLVFCNRITTSAVSTAALLALKYVSFPVQTLVKCAKMIPVMAWGIIIMQKSYKGHDFLFALLITLGCALFFLYPANGVSNHVEKENTPWGVSLMICYLGFDGFTSTFQDMLFKGYDMEIHNQIFYTTMCSCFLSLIGLIGQGHFFAAIEFISRHNRCLYDIAILSTVATTSQFCIVYTIKTFGALAFAVVMTTRQLVSIVLSSLLFAHPLTWKQWAGAVIVFGSLYTRSLSKTMVWGKRREETESKNEQTPPTV